MAEQERWSPKLEALPDPHTLILPDPAHPALVGPRPTFSQELAQEPGPETNAALATGHTLFLQLPVLADPNPTFYKIQPGETLAEIAKRLWDEADKRWELFYATQGLNNEGVADPEQALRIVEPRILQDHNASPTTNARHGETLIAQTPTQLDHPIGRRDGPRDIGDGLRLSAVAESPSIQRAGQGPGTEPDGRDDGAQARGALVVRARGLEMKFPSGAPALEPTNLELYKGELVCLFGSNGAGKSTLIKLIALLDRPSGGTLHLYIPRKREVLATTKQSDIDDLRGQCVTFVEQSNFGLVDKSVLESVAYWLKRYDGLPSSEANQRTLSALRKVRFPPDRYSASAARQLSGGEQARVAIALALARNRPLCLMDEILAPLNPAGRLEAIRLLREYARKDAAVVLVDHNEELHGYFDRLIRLENRHIVDDRRNGTPLA